MNELLSTLLTLLTLYGYPIVASVIFLGYLGLPIPSEALLLAAGALTTDGSLNIFILIPLVTTVSIIGDTTAYFIGRKFGVTFFENYAKWFGISKKRTLTLDVFLQRWGIWAIFITRWLLTPLGIPISLFSGISKYPFKKFFISAFLGETLWVCIYTSLGYFFGANWVSLLSYINDFLGFIFFLVIGIVILFLSWKIIKPIYK